MINTMKKALINIPVVKDTKFPTCLDLEALVIVFLIAVCLQVVRETWAGAHTTYPERHKASEFFYKLKELSSISGTKSII